MVLLSLKVHPWNEEQILSNLARHVITQENIFPRYLKAMECSNVACVSCERRSKARKTSALFCFAFSVVIFLLENLFLH